MRKTPWGEIAFQLGGVEALEVLAEHEQRLTAPAGDVIRRMLPKDKPCLILMDELMNYVSRNRKSGLAAQLYSFLHNLSEEARGHRNVVLAVSIPASELEMSADDHADYERFKKLLDRLGKAVMMSAEAEASEIIRRRLFEWEERMVSQEGKVLLPREAHQTCNEYAGWVVEHRHQLPEWFPVDLAREAFAATYPFHPLVLSVFERKWQALPRFQRTRGILRLLALWVSRAYHDGFKGAHRDALIGLGTAPLDDPLFRAATFEQLGEPRLEAAVTTDICGKKDSHAIRLDREAVDTIKKARLHRKVATAIFFESNGGQLQADATVPEIRLSVGEPDLDIGNVETVLDTLSSACYFLSVERNRYRFSLSPNLNKLLADRRANISPVDIQERMRGEIQKVFPATAGVERIFFPDTSSKILDRPVLTLVILAPEQALQDDKNVMQVVDAMTKECGTSARTFKNALIWCVADSASALREEARKLLAWEAIQDEAGTLRLDEGQQRQLAENLRKAQRDLREAVWRTYKNLLLLGKDNTLRLVDLGLVHSSAADTMVSLILNRLRQDGDVEKDISPNFLTRNWPPAFQEWSTKSVRDMFFASPQFPKLLNADVIKETIARGVANGLLAYVGRAPNGGYEPFYYGTALSATDVDLTEDMFIITKELAERYQANQAQPSPEPSPGTDGKEVEDYTTVVVPPPSARERETADVPIASPSTVTTLKWSGEIPPQRWMNFYTKVLSKFATGQSLKLTLRVEVAPEGGVSTQKIEETRLALRELGLDDDVETSWEGDGS